MHDKCMSIKNLSWKLTLVLPMYQSSYLRFKERSLQIYKLLCCDVSPQLNNT